MQSYSPSLSREYQSTTSPIRESTAKCQCPSSRSNDLIRSQLCSISQDILKEFKQTLTPTKICHSLISKLRWPRELNALQLQKTHANRKSTSKSRKHHQFDSKWYKCSQHNQIPFICSAFLCLVVLWAFAACALSNWESCFLNLQVFFLFAVHWALSTTVVNGNLEMPKIASGLTAKEWTDAIV